jgi:putative transposase
MSEKIIQLNEGIIKEELKDLVRNSVEETLNGLLDKEAAEMPPSMSVPRRERGIVPVITPGICRRLLER